MKHAPPRRQPADRLKSVGFKLLGGAGLCLVVGFVAPPLWLLTALLGVGGLACVAIAGRLAKPAARGVPGWQRGGRVLDGGYISYGPDLYPGDAGYGYDPGMDPGDPGGPGGDGSDDDRPVDSGAWSDSSSGGGYDDSSSSSSDGGSDGSSGGD